jgi:hypothetical protein
MTAAVNCRKRRLVPPVRVSTKKLLDNRTIVPYTGIMKEKRTTQTVQKSIAAFYRENRRMPSYAEMVGLLGVRSKSVVNFWIDKLIEAEILEKDDKSHLKFKMSSFAIPLVGSVRAGFPLPEDLCNHWIDKIYLGGIVVSMIYFIPILISIIQE